MPRDAVSRTANVERTGRHNDLIELSMSQPVVISQMNHRWVDHEHYQLRPPIKT